MFNLLVYRRRIQLAPLAIKDAKNKTQYPKIRGIDIQNFGDRKRMTKINVDYKNNVLSYPEKGIIHEEAGMVTKGILSEEKSFSELTAYRLKEGYSGIHDWSDSKFVELPIPQVCAIVNIGTESQAETKGDNKETTLEYWDKYGNYFKKPILLNAQGSSSMGWPIKNQAVDINDESKIKFGNWCPMDSFHIKKYFIDAFRGQCIVGYWLTEQVYQTRPYGERRPWDYLNTFNDIDKSNGKFNKDFDTGALAHPDGFPVKVFFNGRNAGIYAFNLKKSRNNYNCKKDNQKHIILDGVLGSEFFTANGVLSESVWNLIEIRNPKITEDINGDEYNGDDPKEPSNEFNKCKQAIARLTTAIPLTFAESTDEKKKAKFDEFFNIPFLIDYELISQILFHFDGFRKNWIWITHDGIKWTPTSYDMDSIFGMDWTGLSYLSWSTTTILGIGNNAIPTGDDLLKSLYKTELEARYKELREKGIFSTDNIVSLLENWVKRCGYDNLKEDIEEIVVCEHTVNGEVVKGDDDKPEMVPYTPSYRDGSLTYVFNPYGEGGWYNSIQRVKNWLNVKIAQLDVYYNYNNDNTNNNNDNTNNHNDNRDNIILVTTSHSGLSKGAISGIVIGSIVFVSGITILIIILIKRLKNGAVKA